MSRLLRTILTAVVFLSWPVVGHAHENRPGVLTLEESEPGHFRLAWNAPASGFSSRVTPHFPQHCTVRASSLDCGELGLVGELRFSGLVDRRVEVIVQVTWADGAQQTAVVRAGEPSVRFAGVTEKGWSARAHLAAAYLRLGVEHILGGIDHLCFVAGLLLLVGFCRRLVWTVTAFTLAHSVTLGLAVLGLVSAPAAAVEAVIALSILLVAREVLDTHPTATRRFPWAVAFGFGLLHGFGFAGALQDIGLPRRQIPISLASFNVGVELGQLMAIVTAWFAFWLVGRRLPRPMWWRVGLAYALGGLAAYWTLVRSLEIFT